MGVSRADIDFEGKVCQHLDLGMVQEVLAPELIEEVLETYHTKLHTKW